MPPDSPLDQMNPSIQSFLGNSVTDTGTIKLTRTLDNSMFGLINKPAQGGFPAVVLSGIITEDNSTGTEATDGTIDSDYIIVRPLDDSLVSTPSPLEYGNKKGSEIFTYVQSTIALHAAEYLAKFQFDSPDVNKPTFGEVIECYYEAGGTRERDPNKLRYKVRQGRPTYSKEYRDLLLIAAPGDITAKTVFESGKTLPTKIGDYDTFFEGVNAHSASYHLGGPAGRQALRDRAKAFADQGLSANIAMKRTKKITRIVLHWNASAAGKTMKQALKHESTSTAWGYHYMIDKDGSFLETCPPDYIVYHAGGAWDDSLGIAFHNKGFIPRSKAPSEKPIPEALLKSATYNSSVGWEKGKLKGNSKSNWVETYSKEAIDACITICANLCNTYNISPNNIFPHADVSDSGKPDTGPQIPGGYSLSELKKRVEERMTNIGTIPRLNLDGL